MTTTQPIGRCPACGIGRFQPSGLCDHCGAKKPKSRAALSLEPMELTLEQAERLKSAERDGSARPTITPVALPRAYVTAGERLMQEESRNP